MNPTVVHLVENVVKFLQRLSYDAARESIEHFRQSNVSLLSGDDSFLSLIQCLSLLATAEKGYTSFAFLVPKGFLRKESGTRSVYNLILSDLSRFSADSTTFVATADVDEKTVICHLLRQLHAFVSARLFLMNCYEKLASFGMGRANDLEEVADMAGRCLLQYAGMIHHPMISPLQSMFVTECEVLLQLLKCQLQLSNVKFIDSLASLREAQYRLNGWASEAGPVGSSSPISSWLPFKQVAKPRSPAALRLWYQQFYDLLFSKFSLYFYNVLSRQANTKELFNNMSKVPNNYSARIASFCRKQDVSHFCLILDATSVAHGEWDGYKMPSYHKTACGLENFPIIFSYPPEKPVHLLPSIVMILSENADKLKVQDRICSSYDPPNSREFILAQVEMEIFIVVIIKRTKNNRNPVVTQFVNELCCELRCARLFQSLKPGIK